MLGLYIQQIIFWRLRSVSILKILKSHNHHVTCEHGMLMLEDIGCTIIFNIHRCHILLFHIISRTWNGWGLRCIPSDSWRYWLYKSFITFINFTVMSYPFHVINKQDMNIKVHRINYETRINKEQINISATSM